MTGSDITVKVWGAGFSLDSDTSWRPDQQRPCPGQVADLTDQQQPIAVYLRESLTAGQLVLPSSSELVLADGAYLALASQPAPEQDRRCSDLAPQDGSVVQYRRPAAVSWFDSSAWRQMAVPSPVPDALRVPCPQDRVIFPDNVTYRALVDRRGVTVTSLILGPDVMNNAMFADFLASATGRALFDVSTSVTVTSSPPPCSQGRQGEECACGNDRPEVLSVVCAATRCQPARCSGAITPAGQCCPMCGAYVRVAGGGSVSSVRRVLRAVPEASEVRWHVHRTYQDHVQAVLVDISDGRDASRRVARTLKNQLQGVVSGASVTMEASGPRHAPYTGSGGGGAAAAAVITVLILLALILLLICAVRSGRVSRAGLTRALPCCDPGVGAGVSVRVRERVQRSLTRLPDLALRQRLAAATAAPFNFARFRNDSVAEVELGQRAERLDIPELPDDDSSPPASPDPAAQAPPTAADDVTPAADDVTVAPPPAKPARSFDNPMYDEGRVEEVDESLIVPGGGGMKCTTPDGTSIVNPFFGNRQVTGSAEEVAGATASSSDAASDPPPLPDVAEATPPAAGPPPSGQDDPTETLINIDQSDSDQ